MAPNEPQNKVSVYVSIYKNQDGIETKHSLDRAVSIEDAIKFLQLMQEKLQEQN